MKNIYLFDVDGTLTPARQKMTEEFYSFFKEWIRENSNELINLHDAWITDCEKNELITNIG